MKVSFPFLSAFFSFLLSLLVVPGLPASEKYLDPSLPVEERVRDLMGRMTLEEKVAQMCQYVGIGHAEASKKLIGADQTMDGLDAIAVDNLGLKGVAKRVADGEVSSCLHVTSVQEANRLQELARLSRLKIPLLIGVDAIHGNGLHRGMTIYPTSIGMASTFNPDLVKMSGEQTAREMRASGMHWTFNPNVEITRDPRWGRTGETFGEDTYLVGRMGVALIQGLQGVNGVQPDRVLACAKHMLGGGEPAGGLNAAPMDMSDQKMREVYLPPFEAAIREAHVFTVMPAHNEVNGIPCHGNAFLLQDILRDELGFTGFTISDWMDIERMHGMHHYVPSEKEACSVAVEAGVDMHMHGPHFLEAIVESVQKGRISESRIDKAVAKILEAKFLLGLFEDPFVDVDSASSRIFTEEHRNTALEAARQSIVLLKNKDNLLPLQAGKYKKILITGPNADNQTMMGDWTFEQPRENCVTVVDGIKKIFSDTEILTACTRESALKMKDEEIEKAATLALEADLNIVVVGENALRYAPDKTSGENIDRDNLDLPGRQQELLEKVHASGKPTLLVLINGRPLSLTWADRHIPAILEAWEPGSFGGEAVAEIIAGTTNPSGRLPISIPRNAGQIQTIYNHKASQYSRKFAQAVTGPLYPFGYGLSFTTFSYSDPVVSSKIIGLEDTVTLTCEVTNTGKREGAEVVQFYIRDEYASVTRPVKELKGFQRITLKPGETRKVVFDVTPDVLKFYTARKKWEVEPGTFKLMVGSSSRDSDLKKITLEVQ